ncbi:unnamed protein product [Paramecium octaurelia]|uniref:Uncharacterized protein n=1 Tax=Paramecium octaurelia TaxID=43137 RepID=A0A8S1TY44_PAROT|nr:unnamed protein product [Paramecium octaurelia]
MRAEELTNELTIHYEKQEQNEKNQNIINECYNVFYQHLSSQYREIQGNAIRQFQRLFPLMRQQEVQSIAQELLKSSTQGMNDTRENYHICLQEIVEKIPIKVQSLSEVQEGIIKKLRKLKEPVKKLQVSNQIVHQKIQQNVEIQAKLLKIISQIMSRWPQLFQKDFSDLLLDNITNSNELSIRKNSCVCLGYLGLSLSQQSLNDLIQKKILPLVKELRCDQQSFAKILYLNQSLNHLTKSSGKYFEKDLVEQIFERYHLIHYLLSNYYARAFDQKLIDQITPLIDFNPLGVAAIEDNPYDDDYYIDETSDSTWRVRRCTLYIFQEFLKIQPQQYKVILSALFGPNQIIMKRINEKNSEIKLSIVQFLISLVQASAITNEELNPEDELQSIPPSISLIELVKQLLDKVTLIFKMLQEQQSLKSESTKLLLAIGQYFHSQIQISHLCFSKIVEITINQLLLASILTMKSILKITESAAFQVPILSQMAQILIEAVNQKYIRIQVEGCNTLEILVGVFKQLIVKNQMNYNYQKIQIDILDQEVKQSLFHLLLACLNTFLPYLQKQKSSNQLKPPCLDYRSRLQQITLCYQSNTSRISTIIRHQFQIQPINFRKMTKLKHIQHQLFNSEQQN